MKIISTGLMVIVGCTIFTFCNQTTAQAINQNKMEIVKPSNFNGNAILIGPEIFGQTEEMKTFAQKLSNMRPIK